MKQTTNALTRPYDDQAQKFLAKTGATIETKLLGSMPCFDDDKENRDVYMVTIKRDKKTWSFRFGQSIADSGISKPSDYDILAAITKSDPGTFADFCNDFGYDTDSRRAEKTYFAVQDEWSNVQRMFGDCLKELEAIQ
jgi:hypothetical protein